MPQETQNETEEPKIIDRTLRLAADKYNANYELLEWLWLDDEIQEDLKELELFIYWSSGTNAEQHRQALSAAKTGYINGLGVAGWLEAKSLRFMRGAEDRAMEGEPIVIKDDPEHKELRRKIFPAVCGLFATRFGNYLVQGIEEMTRQTEICKDAPEKPAE